MNIDKAMLDPAEVFSAPEEVLNSDELTRDQKVQILRRWEYDARELEVAEEENMGGGPPDLLSDIHAALRRLEQDGGVSSPTKQGGV